MSPATNTKVVGLHQLVPPSETRMMAWWYGRICMNHRDRTQPKVEVLFRSISADGKPTEQIEIHPINIGALGQVPLGSIWLQGRRVDNLKLEKRRFRVNFGQGGWRMAQSLEREDNGNYLIPPFVYPLLKGFPALPANSWTVRFRLSNGGDLVVPSFELYQRTYGLSSEIHRVLLTYPWHEVVTRVFGSDPLPPPSAGNTWPISLGRYMRHADILFLAHLHHDPETTRIVKTLWPQVMTAQQDRFHLKIIPWQRNTGLIEVLGKPLPKNGFLALHITGIEPPDHPPIEVLGNHRTEKESGNNSSDIGTDVVFITHRKATSGPTMPLADDQPPDHGVGAFRIEDPQFQWLGKQPLIKTIDRGKPREDGGGGRPAGHEDVDHLSFGDRAGSPKGVGKAVAGATLTVESHGTLADMWTATQHLRKLHPDRILDVGYVLWDGRIRHDEPPQLCPVPTVSIKIPNGSRIDPWSFLDSKAKTRRGLLLIWIKTPHCEIVIVEIQRRTRGDKPEEESESFKGLVIRAENGVNEVVDWLKRLVGTLVRNHGIFKPGLIATCPTHATTFKHVHSKKGDVLLEKTVLLALGKADCQQ